MNSTKFKALVHYVISKSEPSRLGSVRLNKILWYADVVSFRATGASISGETYVKRPRGPVSKHILVTLGELEHENAIVIRKRDILSYTMTDYIAMTDPDLNVLSASELAVIESVRALICDEYTANEISEISHNQVWEAANIGEEIPMIATLAESPGEMTREVHDWADGIIAHYEERMAA